MKGKRELKRQCNNDSLLSSYFVSLFSVMLCFVMLFGTTFAWFYTGNASTGNEIHSGILKVDMLHVTGVRNQKVSLAEQADHPVFSSNHLWHPEENSQTETVEVHNLGNVPLDYKLDFVLKQGEVFDPETAKLFTVFVQWDGVWKELGQLDKFLSDTEDEGDHFYLAEWRGQEEGLNPGEFHTIQIKLEMSNAGVHGHMGRSVPVYLKLEAYQHLTLTGVSG